MDKELKHKMYQLKLNEAITITCSVRKNTITIRRVPSGWIYEYHGYSYAEHSPFAVFVPYDDKYMHVYQGL